MSTELVIAMTTCGSLEQAERLGRLLVEKRLAACVVIGGEVRSIYPWDGQIETATERPLTIKTLPERLPDLKKAIERYHPYSVPELLVLSSAEGLEPYNDWVRDWVGSETGSGE